MRRALVALGLLLLATPARPEVMVRVSGREVDLTATAAPLADVLDRLARQTGMKVVYEGPAPRQLVTLAVHSRSPAETVLAVLEGQGLNYAMVGDATGTGVSTLVLAGGPGASATSLSSASSVPSRTAEVPRRGRRFQPAGSSPDAMEPADEEEEPDPTADPAFLGMPTGNEADLPAPPPIAEPTGSASGQAPPPGATQPSAPQGPVVPQQAFPVSPFAPQPQPYPTPQASPGMPVVPGGPPPDAVPGSIPPP
jgi:hypothetical protein